MTALMIWLWLAGVWPFADPGHDDLLAPMVVADLLLHAIGTAWLLNAWWQRWGRDQAHLLADRIERWEP